MKLSRIMQNREPVRVQCSHCRNWVDQTHMWANLDDIWDFWCSNCIESSSFHMHTETGSVDTREGWWYATEDGETVSAVDRGEVVPVRWNIDAECWEAGA